MIKILAMYIYTGPLFKIPTHQMAHHHHALTPKRCHHVHACHDITTYTMRRSDAGKWVAAGLVLVQHTRNSADLTYYSCQLPFTHVVMPAFM